MKGKRVSINLTFSADLDGIPGWGHQPEDWQALVISELMRNSHYDTEVEIHSTKVRRYFWSKRREGYFIPSTRIEAAIRGAIRRFRIWRWERNSSLDRRTLADMAKGWLADQNMRQEERRALNLQD